MSNRLVYAAVLFACAFALRGETVYRIDLIPSGDLVSREVPASKGSMLVFHRHPDGLLMSVRKTDVKKISQISLTEVRPSPADQVLSLIHI